MSRALYSVIAAIALSLSAIAGPSTSRASADDRRIVDVMTYNIHHAAGSDGVLSLPRIAQVIRRSGADVIGLQEVDKHYSARSEWVDQPAELARLLGFHVVFGANIDNAPPESGWPRIQYGTAILSRYPITSWRNTILSSSPGQEPRGLLQATIDVRGASMDFFTTHLAASSSVDRRAQAKQIVGIVGDSDTAVLTGDINAESGAPEVDTLEAAYTDLWTAVGRGEGLTYPADAPTKRIDMIYAADDVRPRRASVVTDAPEASDHLPVIARTELHD